MQASLAESLPSWKSHAQDVTDVLFACFYRIQSDRLISGGWEPSTTADGVRRKKGEVVPLPTDIVGFITEDECQASQTYVLRAEL